MANASSLYDSRIFSNEDIGSTIFSGTAFGFSGARLTFNQDGNWFCNPCRMSGGLFCNAFMGDYSILLTARGCRCRTASDDVMQRFVRPSIDKVKGNSTAEANPLVHEAIETMTGADIVVLGCTKVPTGMSVAAPWVRDRTIDPNTARARAVCAWAGAARQHAG
jgi:hypothetical protein